MLHFRTCSRPHCRDFGAAEGLGGAGVESGYAGYPHTLGAIVVAGAIMALFGLLKVGKVGDFFPSAAVHGMLAAIGVIIMIKQFFPAIGVQPEKASILETATQIPNACFRQTLMLQLSPLPPYSS